MKTKSEHFVTNNKSSWLELKGVLNKISKKGVKKLSNKELEKFPVLYRKVCQDLAEARMLKLSPDVIEYLNNLTAVSHEYLYYINPLSYRCIKTFFTKKLPETIVKNYIFVLISAFIFIGSGAFTFYKVLSEPESAYLIIDKGTLDSLAEMHSVEHNTGRESSFDIYMSSFYINHNISIAFLSFATGIFLGLGTIYFLIYNGIFLGCTFAFLYNRGYGSNIFRFITGHGFLELFGLIIAGGAGLLLGYFVLDAWKNYSRGVLKNNKNRILTLVSSAFFMIGTAAYIEAFISPSSLSYLFKVFVCLFTLLITLFYYIYMPIKISKGEK